MVVLGNIFSFELYTDTYSQYHHWFVPCTAVGKSHNVSTVKHNHHRDKSLTEGEVTLLLGRVGELSSPYT